MKIFGKNKFLTHFMFLALLLFFVGAMFLALKNNNLFTPTNAQEIDISAEVIAGKGSLTISYKGGCLNSSFKADEKGIQTIYHLDPGTWDEIVTITMKAEPSTGYHMSDTPVKSNREDNKWKENGHSFRIKVKWGLGRPKINCQASFSPNEYTVVYNANGGLGEMANQLFKYDTEQALTTNAYSRTGYYFTGWATDGETSYSNNAKVNNLTDANGGTVNLYAIWTPYHHHVDINIMSPSGSQDYKSGTMDVVDDEGNEYFGKADQPDSYIYYGKTWTIKNIKPTIGMSVKSVTSGKGILTNNKGIYTYENNIASVPNGGWDDAIKINMQWNTYEVLYNGNGNTKGTTLTTNATYNSNYYLANCGFSKTGYYFTGWGTTPNGGTIYQPGDSFREWMNNESGTKTLYAQWEPYTFKISYNGNGNTNGLTLTTDATYESNYYFASCGFIKTGYHFIGWGTNPNSGAVYQPGDSFREWMNNGSGVITLYAQWAVNKYEISYNGNGHTEGLTLSTKATYNSNYYLANCGFSKIGYYFTGWGTSANSGAIYQPGDSFREWMNNESGAKTLYAQWSPNKYNIIFNRNGALEGSMSNQILTYDNKDSLNSNEFVKPGYYFQGWSISVNGFVKYKDKEEVLNLTTRRDGTICLYAVWSSTIAQKGQKPNKDGNGNWLIRSAENLAYLILNHTTGYYKQEADIDFGGEIWYPIGTKENPFKGFYDGQGYTINNFIIPNITDAKNHCIHSNIGFFGYVNGSNNGKSRDDSKNNASINNIYIKDVEINGRDNVGVLVGNGTDVKINNCMIENSILNAIGSSGALIGLSNNSIINNCYIKMQSLPNSAQENNAWLFTGTALFNNCLVQNGNLKKQKGDSDTFTEWGRIGNKLIPNRNWIWMALLPDNKVTANDIDAFGGEKI